MAAACAAADGLARHDAGQLHPGAASQGAWRGHKDYQDARLVLPQLPPGANAGGIRPGGINSLLAAMHPSFVAIISGHDFTPASAMFEYMDHTRAGCMPGSAVQGGWEPIASPHQMGMGPKPASLKPQGWAVLPVFAADGTVATGVHRHRHARTTP